MVEAFRWHKNRLLLLLATSNAASQLCYEKHFIRVDGLHEEGGLQLFLNERRFGHEGPGSHLRSWGLG